MKIRMKKIISAVLAVATLMSIALTSSAETTNGDAEANKRIVWSKMPDTPADLSGYELVSEEGYTDSDSGLYFVDRTYVKEISEGTAVQSDHKPFSKRVEKTRSVYRNPSANYGDHLFTMYVSGLFASKNINHIIVSEPNGFTKVENLFIDVKYSEKKFSAANNQGANFLLGHMYAYVEYIITVEIPGSYNGDIRLWLDVNVLGQEHVAE